MWPTLDSVCQRKGRTIDGIELKVVNHHLIGDVKVLEYYIHDRYCTWLRVVD